MIWSPGVSLFHMQLSNRVATLAGIPFSGGLGGLNAGGHAPEVWGSEANLRACSWWWGCGLGEASGIAPVRELRSSTAPHRSTEAVATRKLGGEAPKKRLSRSLAELRAIRPVRGAASVPPVQYFALVHRNPNWWMTGELDLVTREIGQATPNMGNF
ncbi:hypothetical protein K402DRAFT_430823 [Aulographum hederae CBS 113979]|uniref:Uncharacterized protein n=1 Tax=Aulographum hederae CBS 113979 TaxID=1176131 RepID=A0A6G1HGK3_9PEZI|nr:hypothetical protein K402DRAFT_430823 [Aulographum hederae CBS 113979]